MYSLLLMLMLGVDVLDLLDKVGKGVFAVADVAGGAGACLTGEVEGDVGDTTALFEVLDDETPPLPLNN